jgi:protocatechuate 3,4-dioxygenase beta subunit
MDLDDRPVGRILSRREALVVLVASGAALASWRWPTPQAWAQTTTPPCVVRPELTEGPYFVDDQLNRSDIRSEPSDGSVSEGLPLMLAFSVAQLGTTCTPLGGATVDVWHCDALGVYSGVTDAALGFDTVGLKFLRGYQVTDATGGARQLPPGFGLGGQGAGPGPVPPGAPAPVPVQLPPPG